MLQVSPKPSPVQEIVPLVGAEIVHYIQALCIILLCTLHKYFVPSTVHVLYSYHFSAILWLLTQRVSQKTCVLAPQKLNKTTSMIV